jgi:hypothetical protein
MEIKNMFDYVYIKCKYCSLLCKNGDEHIDNCKNYDLDKCFSCGGVNKEYSKNQIKRSDYRRCIECVKNNNFNRYEHYAHLYYDIDDTSIFYYISMINYTKVKELLDKGENPNKHQKRTHNGKILYNKYGNQDEDIDNEQPTTPLKLIVFKYSDCLLDNKQLNILYKIAVLLKDYGANIDEAGEYYKYRYGDCKGDILFNLLCGNDDLKRLVYCD